MVMNESICFQKILNCVLSIVDSKCTHPSKSLTNSKAPYMSQECIMTIYSIFNSLLINGCLRKTILSNILLFLYFFGSN